MLRTLLWLRWTLAWRATNTRNRVATIALTLVMFIAFSPLIIGGALAAHAGVRQYGAPVVVLAFGVCQIVWIWMGLLSGAMGRMFDLDQLIRYPVRTRTVYLVNLFATLTEPLAIGWHAVQRSEITKKDVAIVIGCGPVGLAVITMGFAVSRVIEEI